MQRYVPRVQGAVVTDSRIEVLVEVEALSAEAGAQVASGGSGRELVRRAYTLGEAIGVPRSEERAGALLTVAAVCGMLGAPERAYIFAARASSSGLIRAPMRATYAQSMVHRHRPRFERYHRQLLKWLYETFEAVRWHGYKHAMRGIPMLDSRFIDVQDHDEFLRRVGLGEENVRALARHLRDYPRHRLNGVVSDSLHRIRQRSVARI